MSQGIWKNREKQLEHIKRIGFKKGHKSFISEETYKIIGKKVSIANKGRRLSEEQKKNLSDKFKIIAKQKGYGKWMRGKKHKSETIKKIVNSRKWYKHSEKAKKKMALGKIGAKNPMFGKKPSIEQRKKQSKIMKAYWGPRIDKIHNELYERLRHCLEQRLWRESIFQRDNYICQNCGQIRGDIEADHIKPFILIMRQYKIDSMEKALECKELWDINNGRTLCKTCHFATDTWGSKARNTIFR